MHRSTFWLPFAIMFGLLLLPACKKYQDGPYFSWLTKQDRVTNRWLIDSVQVSDIRPLIAPEVYFFDFDRDSVQIRFPDSLGVIDTFQGAWNLGENKQVIEIEFVEFNDDFLYDTTHRFDIYRLSARQMHLVDNYYNILYLSPE